MSIKKHLSNIKKGVVNATANAMSYPTRTKYDALKYLRDEAATATRIRREMNKAKRDRNSW